MFQKSFQNHNGHFSNRRRFHHPGRNWRSNRGKQKKVIHESVYIKNGVNPIEAKSRVILHKFSDFAIDQRLKENILQKGFTTPTPIQDQAIMPILEGKDVIGIANTGTGKTAAFLIPLINKTLKNQSTNKTLIIAPTRELAEQIRSELIELTRKLGIYSVLVIGGASINRQIGELRRSHQFVIGTPGRLKDMFNRKVLNLSLFNNIVLDEVDRMFDMGFSRDIKLIISQLPKNRQSLFFSATINSEVDQLIKAHSQNPIKISVVRRETTGNVDQDIIKVTDTAKKIEVLHDLLIKEEFEKVLIFGRTKWGVNKLSIELQKRGFQADAIHGGKTQSQRQKALYSFKEGRVSILVATDVAARGLDIPNVTHVINYEVPETYTDYIHRIGRAGRANNTGKALTFVNRA